MNRLWWKAAGVRALKTFAQAIISTGIVFGAVSAGTDWLSVAWTAATIVLSAAGAAGISLLTSIAGLPELICEEPPK
jgi:hypothetical protein